MPGHTSPDPSIVIKGQSSSNAASSSSSSSAASSSRITQQPRQSSRTSSQLPQKQSPFLNKASPGPLYQHGQAQFVESPPATSRRRQSPPLSRRSPEGHRRPRSRGSDGSYDSDDSAGLPYLRPGNSPTTKTFPPSPHVVPEDITSSTHAVGSSSSVPRSKARRRPSPLDLKVDLESPRDVTVQADGDEGAIEDLEPPMTAKSMMSDGAESNISSDLQDLSILRNTVQQNLLARPFDSPLLGSDSGESGGAFTPGIAHDLNSPLPPTSNISISDFLTVLDGPSQSIIIDTRPLGPFLESHFPRSANISIPSLLFKRFRRQAAGSNMTWDSLGSFVSTPAGKEVWDRADVKGELNVLIIGLTAADEMAKVLCKILSALVIRGQTRVLKGGWASVMMSPGANQRLVSGENDKRKDDSRRTSSERDQSPPRTAPVSNAPLPPPAPPSETLPMSLSHHPSLPSLRTTSASKARRNLPALTINPGAQGHSSRRPPKLSLNLDKPLRSASASSFSSEVSHAPMPSPLPRGKDERSGSDQSGDNASRSNAPVSFQTLCHAQSKLPPSPSSFRDVEERARPGTRLPNGSSPGLYDRSTGNATARPDHFNIPNIYPTPATPDAGPSSPSTSTGVHTARNLSPFVISTILPGFLYLGPEITTENDVQKLVKTGVKRILNVAIECDDDEGLGLKKTFDRYHRIPMKDIVEESGVGRGLREACDVLDDARLHSAPTYVHCKAGKSRSVTVVLAYLIHANAWTLKMAYAYVAERRKGISPNIGFVAELMQFEENELGLKQSGGVHGEAASGKSARSTHHNHHDDSDSDGDMHSGGGPSPVDGDGNPRPPGSARGRGRGGGGNKYAARYARESLPPAWAQSLDTYPRVVPLHGEGGDGNEEAGDGRKPVADEREVRKNGHWVHHRRAPFDRTTLQPGRRVSKAGLESLRTLASTPNGTHHDSKRGKSDDPAEGETGSGPNTPRPIGSDKSSPRALPSPRPMADVQQKSSSTPGVDGRLGWV